MSRRRRFRSNDNPEHFQLVSNRTFNVMAGLGPASRGNLPDLQRFHLRAHPDWVESGCALILRFCACSIRKTGPHFSGTCARACWDLSRVYHGCDQMDHGGEALIGLAGAHCDTFELLELAEEVLDEMPPFVHLLVEGEEGFARRGCWEITALAPRASRSAMMMLLSNALSAISASKANPSISGGMPTVSKRCPGRSTKRTRLPSASVRARILVVIPPFELLIAWLWVPLLRPVRGDGP